MYSIRQKVSFIDHKVATGKYICKKAGRENILNAFLKLVTIFVFYSVCDRVIKSVKRKFRLQTAAIRLLGHRWHRQKETSDW